ncbi:stage II sporulation protein E (SpoIIE) domain-containing protein [Ditylenchus destructor]|nr:stage II sporulation protein E (SpoIIE) domain-containing protein [Ditylenchus destructor]
MFASRLLARAGPANLVREIRGAVARQQSSSLCASAAVLVGTAATAAPSPATAEAQPKVAAQKISTNKVDVTRCGFPKKLVGAPSFVLECDVIGEDACFITNFKSTHVTGVADGVGGWQKYGIDPSVVSSKLMRNCADIVKEGDFEPSRPDLIISKAYNRLKASPRPIGSCTACVLVVHQKTLYSANLGDSGYLVCRKGQVIHRSKEQTHYFNAPYQLTLMPEHFDTENYIVDTPEKADLQKLELQSGDVILLATDGLWDNVPENIIIEALSEAKPHTLQATCNSIALIARRLSLDEQYLSPFAEKARHHGENYRGGKPDDITCIVMFIS